MPEFILNHGTPQASEQYCALDPFTRGYVEAMFFTETGDLEDGELQHANVAELAPESWECIAKDCAAFQATDAFKSQWFDYEHAGRDFWYTRNGHGCGFWDGDWSEPHATALTEAARQFDFIDLYRGGDGLIYLY